MPALITEPDEKHTERTSQDAAPARTSRLALASLALGMVSVFPPSGLLGIVLGHWSLARARAHKELRGANVAHFALLLNYLGLGLFAALLLLIAKAPSVTHRFGVVLPASLYRLVGVDYSTLTSTPAAAKLASMPNSERIAIEMVRSVAIAEVNHSSQHKKAGFTCDLGALIESGLDDKLLNSAASSGYTLVLQGCTQDPRGAVTSYQAIAVPPHAGENAYCIDETGLPQRHNAPENCLSLGTPVQ